MNDIYHARIVIVHVISVKCRQQSAPPPAPKRNSPTTTNIRFNMIQLGNTRGWFVYMGTMLQTLVKTKVDFSGNGPTKIYELSVTLISLFPAASIS